MKLSHNALNFLLAQYRAIFKKAYIKGLAPAVLLTAGLAAGSVQALPSAVTFDNADKLPAAGQTITITGINYDGNAPSGSYTNLQISSGSFSDWNGEVIVQSGAASTTDGNKIVGTKAAVSLSGSGTLTIDITNGDPKSSGLIIGGNMGNDVAISLGTINVNKGQLKITDKPGNSHSGSTTVAADTINIGSEDSTDTGLITLSSAGSGKTATLGHSGSTTESGSDITIYGNGTLTVETSTGAGTKIYGETLSLVGGATMLTSQGDDSKNIEHVYHLEVDADSFKVISGDGTGATFSGHTASIAGNLLVDSGSEWVLAATDDDDTTDVTEGTTTFESGANVQLSGSITVSGGKLTVADGAGLYAAQDSDGTSNAGTIVVAKKAANDLGTLEISSTHLQQFLNAKDAASEDVKYTEITVAGGKPGLGESGAATAVKGSVFLSGGVLALTDEKTVDLATDLAFSGGATSGSAGIITIHSDGGTVKGHDLLVSKKIDKVASTNKLSVEADLLTIGVGSGGEETKLTEFGLSGATAHDVVDLTANDGSGTFIIDTNLYLKRDYYDKDADDNNLATVKAPGRITGDDLVISGTGTPKINITGGAWVNDNRQSLTIKSGGLAITAGKGEDATVSGSDSIGDDWNYVEGGNPAELTWQGDFIFEAESNNVANATVSVSGAKGADAILDLTQADVTWGSGKITLSGTLATGADDPDQISSTDYFKRAGLGILKLDGDQVGEYLDLINDGATTATTLQAQSGGLILVSGNINDAIDVAKFEKESTASAGKINLSGGNMFVTGSLSLVDGVGTDGKADASADILKIDGVLGANSISFTNKSSSINDKNKGTDKDDVATVSGGTLAVASSFSSDNHAVKFQDGAGLLLDSKGFLSDYAPESANEGGNVYVDHLIFTGKDTAGGDASELDVQTGKWTIGTASNLGDVSLLSGGALNVGPEDEQEYIRTGVGASLTLDNLGITNGTAKSGSVVVQEGGSLTVNTLQMADGATMTVSGTVTLTGILDSSTIADNKVDTNAPETLKGIGNAEKIQKQAGIALNGAEITLNSGKFVFGDTAARALITFDADAKDGSKVVLNDGLKGVEFKLEGTSELRLDFTKKEGEQTLTGVNDGLALTAAQAKELKEKLVTGQPLSDSVGSYINVGDLALGMEYDSGSMTAQWDKIKDFVQIESDVTNDDYIQLLVQKADQDLAGQFGAIETPSGQQTATVAGNLGLHKAYGEGEKFFASTVQNGQRVAAGLTLDADSSVALYGEGTVGTLRGQGTDSNTTVVFKASEEAIAQSGVTTVKPINTNDSAIVGVGAMSVENDVVVEGKAEVGSLQVTHSLNAENLNLGNKAGADSTVFGTVDVADTLSVGNDSTLFVADGVVNTTNLVLDGATLMVGWDAQGADNPKTDLVENQSYTGSLYASTIELKNGGIVVDPALDQNTAIVGFNQFKGGNRTKTSFDLGKTGGNLFVGQNSVIGAGFATMADLEEFIAPQQVNGALSGQYKAIFALDGLLTLSADTGLTMTAQSYQDFVDYIKSGSGSHWASNLTNHGTIKNAVYFGADSALKLSSEAVQEAEGANAAQAVITLDKANGQLIANGGEILISGDLRANNQTSYKLFADQGGASDANGTKVAVVDINGTAVANDKGIKVTTENGFLFGMINNTNGGTINLQVDKAHARSIMSGASEPVVNTLIAYAQGYNYEWTDATGTHYDELYDGYELDDNGEVKMGPDDQPIKDTDYNNYFLAASIEQGNGAAAEAVARLGIYGGAPQAALSAGKSSTDAIASRFGIGSAISNLTLAGNTQGATLWLAPVYKSADSDGFEAQGVDYGVNVDLYGVALGADYTLGNGVTFGAMFNVGSGDIDGEGAAAAVSNDFDYYGFGISVDKIGAKMDSSNLSLGVTGKYALEFNGVNITPHAGLRFSNIDLDDYTIDGEYVVAHADSDSLNLFAIPVGVTIAKEFKGESWTVAPSFDLTLTGQFGDDELDGDVAWAGVSNLTTHTTTEVIDNFTYGATLGVEAQSVGGIALGLSVGYTGSSNTDEFGVNANARFTF